MDRQEPVESEHQEQHLCRCPFCDNAVRMPYPFCQACGAELRYCPRCGQPLAQDAQVCPHCAGAL